MIRKWVFSVFISVLLLSTVLGTQLVGKEADVETRKPLHEAGTQSYVTMSNVTGQESSNEVYYIAYGENLLRRFTFNGTSWSLEIIGTVGAPPDYKPNAIEIGDARNDGFYRVYVGTDQIYEFTWNGTSWVREVISTLQAYALDIGDGDNDGKQEIYAGNNNNVYQIEWNGSSWISTFIGIAGGYSVAQPIVGDVEGHDGENELYVSGYDSDIWNKGFVQFKWNGSSWIRTVLGGAEQPYWGIELGDGDNDGQNEVYQSNANWPVYQYKWTAPGWSKTGINSYFGPTYPEIGDADNDGQNEVYIVRDPTCASGSGCFRIYQHKWDGSSWIANVVNAPDTRRKAVGDGDNDGKQEIYAGTTNLYQIRWNGTSWVSFDLGVATSTWIQYITVGDGDTGHDVAVLNVTSSMDEVYAGEAVNITVSIKNEGTVSETFNVSSYYDDTLIGTIAITDLGSLETESVYFTWNTTGVAGGHYTISANTSVISGEKNRIDNAFIDGMVKVTSPVRILEVVPCNQTGYPKDIFQLGTMAFFKVTINSTALIPQDTLITVNLYDNASFTIGIASFQGPIQPDTSTIIFGLPIPTTATTGTATIYANAYTDWPHLGGFPHCPEKSATLKITGP